jgi:hypothetical protein
MTFSCRKRRIVCTLLIVGLPPLVLAGAWRLGGVSALEDDLVYYLPIRAFIGESIRAGSWPLWNPYVALGTSVAADPQSGLWYPLTLLFVALPALWAYSITICVHFALAGGGMYRFLRAIGRDWRAALLGAVAFEFCGFIVAHRAHLTILEATAWLPWMLYAWHRFATTGRRSYFVLATACLGMQMLVQHIQITIIGGAIVTAYVVAVLRPSRRSLLWEYPAGLILGGMIGAVQLLPTAAAFARCGRSAPAYYLFIENSYAPTSVFMWLFPFLFGSRTPNFYGQPWWGWSHLCEQATYTSIAVLLLAIASLALWRRDRQVRFWSLAMVACVLLALGGFTPLSRLLFHVPVLRSLRAPARWMLGFNVAMVILAVTAADALIRRRPGFEAVGRWLGIGVTRVLPAAAAALLLAMVLARSLPAEFVDERIVADLEAAIRPANPAIWLPLIMMALTAAALVNLLRGVRSSRLIPLFAVAMIDLASFAAFDDVDTREYANARSLVEPPPLARAMTRIRAQDRPARAATTAAQGRQRSPSGSTSGAPAAAGAPVAPRTGDRLWVPRVRADYRRPIEVLWPQTNVLHHVPTLNGYGPMSPVEYRALLHFMPWGAAQDALGLLYTPRLLQALGVRWLAARSEPERELMSLALHGMSMTQPLPACNPGEEIRLHGSEWHAPISMPTPGVYAVEFRASPGDYDRDRWYLWLTTASDEKIGETLWYEPTDLTVGPRTLRGFFICREPAPNAVIHAYGEPRCDVLVRDVRFGRIAGWPPGPPVPGPYVRAADLPDGTTLYELRDSRPRYAWADSDSPAGRINDMVERLRSVPDGAALPGGVLTTARTSQSASTRGTIHVVREELNRVVLDVTNDSAGTLVFNETFDPGWHATIDGGSAEILQANAVLQAVRVPAGRHRVEFCYRPQRLFLGTTVSVAGVVTLAAVAAANRRRRAA